jgi:hypothetical protein
VHITLEPIFIAFFTYSQEICAAWKRPPVTEMSVQEYGQWMKVEQQLRELKKQKDLEQMKKFRDMVMKPQRHQPNSIVDETNNKVFETATLKQSNTIVQNPFARNKGIADESYAYNDDDEYYDRYYNYNNGYEERGVNKELSAAINEK